MVTIEQVATAEQIRQTQELFIAYFEFLRTDVDKVDDLDTVPPLAGYRDEIARLPGRYAPPDGCLLLAQEAGEGAGCIAFYKLEDGVCEVKRLWVSPRFRGLKVGRKLVETLIGEARRLGYHTIRLSTVDVLTDAIALYQSLGFKPTAPYFDLPPDMLAHEIFLQLDLSP